MPGIETLPPPRLRAWIAIIALCGLILRIAAARGSLWLDEAWSAVLAHQVQTPLGVFVQINHDNNHHLNSLWLQFVGLGAPPLVARALSIAAGTLAVFVAGLIGARRGPAAGIATALLFAVSPVMVNLGSEARGYAPMMLMVLIAIWYVDRFLDGEPEADRPATLAICFFVGALFQLTMAFMACALVGWVLLALWRRDGWRIAIGRTARLLGPACGALLLAVGIVFAPVLMGGAEFRLGSIAPFSFSDLGIGLRTMLGYTLGLPALLLALVGALALAMRTPRLAFYALALIAFPLAIVVLRPVNAGHARYYLLIGMALLLLVGEALPALLRRSRPAAIGAILVLGTACLASDLALIRDGRGDVAPAVDALAVRAPQGAHVGVVRESGLALMEVAAAEGRYPIRVDNACRSARFVFTEWFEGEAPDRFATRLCGAGLRAITSARSRGPSGQNWTLYERVG
ncbi:hypothetical protein ACFSCW_07645 [Sphingomonas tabacisoli]|uniref:Glycosyltransferase RgtA/B/C/D-like domain-containing protein n=1 Tax=Sphingomonas tabacisoli TaxID=2249466 RepID=A0ABW4I316_9SPHN